MKLTILGSGTSHGVPMIGCSCRTCLSSDPRDNRTNASLLIEMGGKNILIDCGRDFRQQALRHKLERVDYVLLTHTHFDHVAGIDDLRVFNRHGQPIPIFGTQEHLSYLKTYIYHYLFDPAIQKGGGVTELDLVAVSERFSLDGVLFETLPVLHGELPVYGYRFGGCAYLCDVSCIPQPTLQKLQNLDTLILGALRHTPHKTHFTLAQALEVVAEIKPRRAFFTHLCHDVLHAAVEPLFRQEGSSYYAPTEVHLAYDGLTLELERQ
jgi:phosphoribosyl 1,2-cyclic phosphate phosphodiesterase